MSKPSYLFGTMHLQDKRVYDLGDSLLVKLMECPSFAMEITPDSMLHYLFVEMDLQKDEETINNIRKYLSEEEWYVGVSGPYPLNKDQSDGRRTDKPYYKPYNKQELATAL